MLVYNRWACEYSAYRSWFRKVYDIPTEHSLRQFALVQAVANEMPLAIFRSRIVSVVREAMLDNCPERGHK